MWHDSVYNRDFKKEHTRDVVCVLFVFLMPSLRIDFVKLLTGVD